MLDPVEVVVQALVAKGYDVHGTFAEAGIDKSALSTPGYVWVEEMIGTTPHIRYSDRPTVQVVVYSNLGYAESSRISRRIQKDLEASRGTVFTSGGIHRVITLIRPHREDLQGLPPGVGRSVAQYELILTTTEKWGL